MKQKRVPLRMCLGCQEMKSKKELIRIVRDKDGCTSVDFSGKKAGRGAYICKSMECFTKARKGKRIEKAFEAHIDDTVYDTLKKQLEENDD